MDEWVFVAVTRIVGGDVAGDFSAMLRVSVELDGCGFAVCRCGELVIIACTEADMLLLLLYRQMTRKAVRSVASIRLRILLEANRQEVLAAHLSTQGTSLSDSGNLVRHN